MSNIESIAMKVPVRPTPALKFKIINQISHINKYVDLAV